MKILIAIFLAIILATLGSFAVLWAVSPITEKENVMASQGIRLIGSAVVVSAENSLTPTRVKVGDLLIGSGEQVFRVNELRKSQNNKIYAVVSWKYITSFTSYEEYITEPYMNYKTYELNAFAFNKKLIQETELVQFYGNYSKNLANNIEKEARKQLDATKITEKTSQTHVQVATPTSAPSTSADTRRVVRATEASPRDYMTATEAQSVQTYSTAEVSKPTDMDATSVQSLEKILSDQATEKVNTDVDPIE